MSEPAKFLSSRFLSASTLIGAAIANPQGESLGDLKDVMIDSASGKIAYGLLSFGGVLGLGNKLFAIPWQHFHVAVENESLLLDISRERLKDAPGFDADHWPDFANPAFADELDRHYARTPASQRQVSHPD